jgi:ABC-type multidrug transport system fused ATPase/permease subunit
MSILSAIAVGPTLLLGERYISAGLLTKGELITLIAYMGSIMWPIIIIIDQWSVLLQGLASVDRIYELFGIPTEDAAVTQLSEQPQSHPQDGEQQTAITFRAVSFQYPETRRGVIDLSFTIHKGERIGIVGATGSGKSTISRLILGLVSPDSGSISIGGAPIATIPREKLREMVAFMPQHPEMFSGTPLENIILWDPHAEHFTKKITLLPESVVDLCTTDNDAATSLSLGEQQCIAALRILVRDPEIIVLDEPTAAIDPILEQWLMNTIFTPDSARTSLIIAHRLGTLERCDRIVMMKEGRIVDEGRHDELMQRSTAYRQVVEADARR